MTRELATGLESFNPLTNLEPVMASAGADEDSDLLDIYAPLSEEQRLNTYQPCKAKLLVSPESLSLEMLLNHKWASRPTSENSSTYFLLQYTFRGVDESAWIAQHRPAAKELRRAIDRCGLRLFATERAVGIGFDLSGKLIHGRADAILIDPKTDTLYVVECKQTDRKAASDVSRIMKTAAVQAALYALCIASTCHFYKVSTRVFMIHYGTDELSLWTSVPDAEWLQTILCPNLARFIRPRDDDLQQRVLKVLRNAASMQVIDGFKGAAPHLDTGDLFSKLQISK